MEEILANEESRKIFTEHCSRTYASENLLFWEAIQEFRQIEDDVILPIRGKAIFDKFLVYGAAMQVSLDVEIIENIKNSLNNLDRGSYDEAESCVVTILQNHAINTGFIKSQQDIQVVGKWNHSSLPSDSKLAKQIEKELVQMDFKKVHVGMETIKIEEDNKRMNTWCTMLEKDSENNRKQIENLKKQLEKIKNEREYLEQRELQLTNTLQQTKNTIKVLKAQNIGEIIDNQ
mmetsp:Transcript_29578/g.50595  ORF Transcript_29578/g.50595 Transcript_29578/m.50595 type:complete len:232 (-) Transcript_29578:28-723(-)